jgi:F-type H+-transporting ATPase subunit epsilon
VATTHLSVITPISVKFEGEAELVIAPGAAGDLGALPQHAPLLTTLRAGVVKANVIGTAADEAKAASAVAGGRVEFAVDGGLMQVLPDRVIILTDMALSRAEVDVEAARGELQRALEALAAKKGADDLQERRAVAWAQAKLEVAHRTADV